MLHVVTVSSVLGDMIVICGSLAVLYNCTYIYIDQHSRICTWVTEKQNENACALAQTRHICIQAPSAYLRTLICIYLYKHMYVHIYIYICAYVYL